MKLSRPQESALIDAHRYGLHQPKGHRAWTGAGACFHQNPTIDVLRRRGSIEMRDGRLRSTPIGVEQLQMMLEAIL